MRVGARKPQGAGGGSKEKPFDRTRDAAWAVEVNRWPWIDRDEDTSAKSGPCPRCKHQISFVDSTAVYSRFSIREQIDEPSRKYAACNCGVKHPDAAEGEIGCGANGLIDRPGPASGKRAS